MRPIKIQEFHPYVGTVAEAALAEILEIQLGTLKQILSYSDFGYTSEINHL